MKWIAIGLGEVRRKDSQLMQYHSGADSGQAGVDVLVNYSIDILLFFFSPGMTY